MVEYVTKKEFNLLVFFVIIYGIMMILMQGRLP